MARPQKRAGFAQGIMAISADKKEAIGTLRVTHDGRKFRYAKADASGLGAGKMSVASEPNAQIIDVNVVAAAAGARTIQLTGLTWAADIDENGLAGGYLQICDGTNEGLQYLIESNTAFVTGLTTIDITLEEPLQEALSGSGTTEVSVIPSLWYDTTESEVEESIPVGIPPVDVTADYYYWSQTGGVAIALCHGTPAVGTMLVLSSMPPGGLRAMAASVDIDTPIVAKQIATVGVSGEYKPVQLLID